MTQDQMVYAGTRMICLSFENGNEEYRSLVTKRRQYEDLMTDLFAFYNDDTIKAPEAGFVGGIDKSIIKNTAALDKKPVLKLLAENTTGTHSILVVRKLDENTVIGIKVDGNLEREKLLNMYGKYLQYNSTGQTTVPDGLEIYLINTVLSIFTPDDYKGNIKEYDLITTVGEFPDYPPYKPAEIIYGGMNFGTLIKESLAPTPEVDYGGFDIGDFVMDIGGAGEAKDEDAALLQKTTVMTVIPDTSMTVTMDVDELDIAYYEPGQKADILVDALPNQSFTAVVEEVSAVGKNSGGNSKYTVKLRLDRAPDMLNGMNASVVVHRGVTSGLVLPAAAVYDRGSQCFVYTAADKKTGTLIGELPVVTGVSDGEMVEIVSGLAEGQVVFYEYYLPVEEGN